MGAPVDWRSFQCVCGFALLLGLAGTSARTEERASASAQIQLALSGAPGSPAFLRGDAVDSPEGDEPPADPDQALAPQPPAAPTEDENKGAEASDSPPPGSPGETELAEQPALPPVNAALRAALERRTAPNFRDPFGPLGRWEREAVAAFYMARSFAPLWTTDGVANLEVASVVARLERAAEDGLDVKRVPLRPTPGMSTEDLISADIALSEAVVAYAREATGSRIDPHAISPLIGARPEVADASVILAIVATSGAEAGDALRGYNPPQKGYEALRQKLAELRRDRRPAARAPSIPSGPTLKVGMRDPRVPLVRARLSLDGKKSGAIEDLVYDTKVATAVADFQKANGLPASGVLTARTVSVLSGGEPTRLEAEILANMERWRWMPRDMGDSRIEVNIPDFQVSVIENGEVVQRNRVVVGKEQTPTPIFSNTMRFLIVNPAWNVPQSIIRKEMLPKLGSLRQLGYQVAYVGGRLTVRQPPGERNALGRIKFMFPNDYSVYLHDTPSRALFAESRRAFSHGCVRVDDPFRFAETILGRANGWSEERVKKLIGGKERYVTLPKPLPVHLEYFTTYVDDSGRLQQRDDIYGYSRRVKAALGLES